jgi:hypothetical protein
VYHRTQWVGLLASFDSKLSKLKYTEPHFRAMYQLTASKIHAVICSTLYGNIDSKYTE